jgi:hypothetical protein
MIIDMGYERRWVSIWLILGELDDGNDCGTLRDDVLIHYCMMY